MKKIRSSSLLIGKVINQELRDILPIYPIVAPNGTVGNFGVYKRLSLTVDNTKDIYNYIEKTDVAITVVSDKYEEGLTIATNIKMYLEHLKGVYKTQKDEELHIADITLTDANEDWGNDKYIQNMVFSISLYNELDSFH